MFVVCCYYGIVWPISQWSALGWWTILLTFITVFFFVYLLWNAGEIARTTDILTEQFIADQHKRSIRAINQNMKRLVDTRVIQLGNQTMSSRIAS
tara:strand:+ start:4310 stop:4594 length:285 start_codon:yes stop_codon:yes gene_type:complete